MTASAAGPWPPDTRTRFSAVLKLILGLAVIFAIVATLGWLVTGPAEHVWPLRSEDGVDRSLAQHRNHALTAVSGFFSTLGNTPAAIALSLVAFAAIRLLTHRWAEALFVAAALLGEVAVFLLTTMAVERPRPAVPHLDPHAPPTSSFPSGHVAAAVALYAAVALVLRRHGAPRSAWLLLAVPCAVGFSRLYRGMHHPSDLLAGVVLGTLCVLWARRTVLTRRDPR